MVTSTATRIRRPVRTVVDEQGERHTVRVRPPGRANARRAAIAEQIGWR